MPGGVNPFWIRSIRPWARSTKGCVRREVFEIKHVLLCSGAWLGPIQEFPRQQLQKPLRTTSEVVFHHQGAPPSSPPMINAIPVPPTCNARGDGSGRDMRNSRRGLGADAYSAAPVPCTCSTSLSEIEVGVPERNPDMTEVTAGPPPLWEWTGMVVIWSLSCAHGKWDTVVSGHQRKL